MAIEVKLSADCKTLTIAGGSSGSPVEVWINEVQYPMVDPANSPTNQTNAAVDLERLGGISPAPSLTNNNFPSGELTITWDNIPGISTEQLNGVIKVIITEPDPIGNVTFGAVGLCALNCCLATKVKELLECKCKECKECVVMLSELTNVYLLMEGMQVNIAGCVQTTALYMKTADQYAKAVSICGVENCNCNC
jgi:hypothetical protein|tara:strand:+ start:819 stop:1400 length:582 start_codon:yes stop_codon:yes gene_type:complete